MEEHNHHHPPPKSHWATKVYYVTYVTGLLSIVLSLWTSVHLVASGTRPHLGHVLMVASLLITTICALPYIWSKRFARYKLFAYLAGWSVSLLLLIIASIRP